MVKFLFIIPFCLLLFGYYQSCFQNNKTFPSVQSLCAFARRGRHKYKSEEALPSYSAVGVSSSTFSNSNQRFSNGPYLKLPSYFGAIAVLVCFMSVGVSLAFAFTIIPRQIMPWTGLLLMVEWTFVAFFLLFGSYLRFVYRWGSISANYSDSSENRAGTGHQHNMSDCDTQATFYWTGMAVIALVTVFSPTILGITALFTKLGLMVAAGVVLASFMTYASEHLAISAFYKGQKDRSGSRTRRICFLCL